MIQKHFFHIYGALIDPDAEPNNKILIKVVTLVFRCTTVVSFRQFMEASKDAKGNPLISENAFNQL